uniref:Large ribosomal subunit protein uL5c n=1 Tax=Palmophyllum crassum TaxID=1615899 RepID=A0A1L7NXW8_9VIRI|nr:ribosomal protein L5 [Palmophyllum crassum]BAW34760.1 ribosomal protein L5 [Palmophyllum crassum]
MSIQTQNFYNFYIEKVQPELSSYLKIKNLHQLPKIKKIVINRGLGQLVQNPKQITNSLNELALISGQSGIIRKSKKSIANFKIRENMPVGISITLRGKKMYAFLDRLINFSLARIRDFRGLSYKNFDGNGNFNFGLNEQFMFPEINFESVKNIEGINITIVTTTKNDNIAWFLLSCFGFPFNKKFEKQTF